MNWAKIGDICDLVNGKAFKPSDWARFGAPIIRIQNLNNAEKAFNYWEGDLDRQVRVQTGDVLLAWSGTPGTSFGVHIWDRGSGILNQHIFRVDLDTKKVTPRWFMHAVNGQLNRLIEQAHGGVGLQHVTRPMVDELQIPLPPLKEQRRIAAILDKTDVLRRDLKRALDLLDSLVHSTYLEMFGDPNSAFDLPKLPLGDALHDIESGWSPVCMDRPAQAFEPGVLKLSCINRRGFVADENKGLPPSLRPKPQLEVLPGDILFSRKNTRELVGASVYIWETRSNLYLSDLIFRLVAKDNIVSPVFLQAQLSISSQRQKIAELAGGVAGSMPNISKARLRELKIAVPSISKQAAFEESCRSRYSMQVKASAMLVAVNSLFTSLQHRAFSGQL